jgi:hypothetical protein
VHELELIGMEGLTIVTEPPPKLVGHAGLDVI